jgi:hypothetical protein
MTERKSLRRSHTRLTIEERAEVEALETLTLTRKSSPLCKGCPHSEAVGRGVEHQSEDGVQTGQGWANSELPRRYGGQV